jgi:hypothetical protein
MNPYSRFVNQNEIDLNQSGLVGAWKLKSVNESVADLVGSADLSRFGAPVYEVDSFLDTIRFDGVKDYLRAAVSDYRGSDSQGVISFWFKVNNDAVSQILISSSDEATTNYTFFISLRATGGQLLIQLWQETLAGVQARLNGTTDIAPGIWHHLSVVSTGTNYLIFLNGQVENFTIITGSDNGNWFADTPNRDNFVLGALVQTSIGTFFDGQIRQVEIFSDAKDADWVAAKYKEGAETIQFKTDYGVVESVADETEGNVGITSPFRISSGGFKMVEDTIEGESVKVIECVSDGINYLPTSFFLGNDIEDSFGDFEFWFYKGSGTTPFVLFIADVIGGEGASGQDGYSIEFRNSDKTIRLREINNGSVSNLFVTAGSFFIDDFWYKIKITRSNVGEFSVYLNDVLVDVTGGSGSNPVTDLTNIISKYFILNLDAGDKVAYSDIQGNYSFIKRLGV